jgi:ribose transport system ATP-binding protein
VGVLRDVSFRLQAGQTLGLVGENGAGKSTLMNLIGGNLRPDAGGFQLNGAAYAPASPAEAMRAGIAFIHQELNLFPNLTIAENIFLTAFPCGGGLIDRHALAERTRRVLQDVGLALPPDTPVSQLSAGQSQLIEIAKALARDARLIIFDEPTTSLSVRETEALFTLMAKLRARGLSMIYISHALADVLRLSDEIVVLRDGAVVAAGPRNGFTLEQMIGQMVGRSLPQLFPARRGRPSEEALLEVRGLSEPDIVRDISFVLRRGEVLGIGGLMGAGRSELARILFGLDRYQSGEIRLAGRPIAPRSPAAALREGMAFLTEDRREEGLCLEASVADNLALVSLREFTQRWTGLLDFPRWRQSLAAMRRAIRLNPQARDNQPVGTLSGGNQQKVVLGKWLLAEPRVLILDEPTRGVDVGAKVELYQMIQELAERGAAVLLISSEWEELAGLCDRILVMNRGAIAGEFARADFDRERLLQAALPVGEGSA